MAKIVMREIEIQTIANTFEDFLNARKAKGIADKTIKTYTGQFKAIAHHVDVNMSIENLNKAHLEQMIISMRSSDKHISPNTIATYARFFRVFLSWCHEEGLTNVTMQKYKEVETIKETYTDDELEKLLKKPNMSKCKFTEYRDWAIINLLVNSGCRASSIRHIENKDVDLSAKMITLRHNKSKRIQVLPLCTAMVSVLKEYMKIRGGEATDYLFPNGKHIDDPSLDAFLGQDVGGVQRFGHLYAAGDDGQIPAVPEQDRFAELKFHLRIVDAWDARAGIADKEGAIGIRNLGQQLFGHHRVADIHNGHPGDGPQRGDILVGGVRSAVERGDDAGVAA